MSRKAWRNAIARELVKKGFSKSGALKTAKRTIRKSLAKRKRENKNPLGKEKPVPVAMRELGAIHQKSTLAGKIVVIQPEKGIS